MINLNKEDITYNKESIYKELKDFHDTNIGVLYSYQDFEIAGMREYKTIFNKVRPLKEYEKNRLSTGLMKILKNTVDNEEEGLQKTHGYLTLNPIINYYENFISELKALKESDVNTARRLNLLFYNLLLNSKSSEEVKLALICANVFNFKGIESILSVFSIHNDYIFYVIKIYENMKNGNELIFELAKKSKGYGKLFSVMKLQPVDYQIKNWMINYGYENNLETPELLFYTMLSLDLLEYLEDSKFDESEIDLFSKGFCILLSEYSLDEISDQIKFCKKFLEKIDISGKGIYSLYAVISIMYSIESLVLEDYKSNTGDSSENFYKYKDIMEYCKKICSKPMWNKIIFKELSDIELETSVLISCAERTGYKLRKSEFELMLKRDNTSALLYKYAFSVGNKSIKKFAFKFGLEKLPMNELLSGQDEIKLEDLSYKDIAQVCFFIIIKYAKYEDFPEEYKELNLKALKSPIIDTRMEALINLEDLKEELVDLDDLDEEIIEDSISTEIVSNIRRRLSLLIRKKGNKERKYVEVNSVKIMPHVKDIYLISVNIADTKNIDMSETCGDLYEGDIVYLKRKFNNPYDEKAIQVVTLKGYVIGYVPKEENSILKNLMDNGKYLYGIIREISDDYEEIKIKIYLSYKDVLDEISTTLSLLSGEREDYVQ